MSKAYSDKTMLTLTKLVIIISIAKLFSGKTTHTLTKITKFSLKDVHTVCYITNIENDYFSKFLTENTVPFLTINPEIYSENTKLCGGYIVHSQTAKDFSKIILTFTFLAHRRILLFLCEKYVNERVIEEQVYEKAIFLTVIEDFKDTDENNKTTKVIFVTSNKILEGKRVTQEDFQSSWTPKLLKSKLGNSGKFKGIDYDIFNAIAEGWPVEFLPEETENNTRRNFFVEIIDKIVRKERDIAMCGLWQRVLLEKKVDYSMAYASDCLTFLVAKPRLLGDSTFIFQPFCNELWFAIFVIFMVVVFFKRMVASVYRRLGLERPDIDVMKLVSYLSPGSSSIKSPMESVRALFLFWVLFCMMTVTYYSAGLTISLRFPRYDRVINTFEDMVRLGIRWEEPLSDIQQWLLETNHSLYQDLGRLYFYGNDKEAMNRRLRTGNYGLLVKIVDNKYAMNAEDLDESGKMNLKLVPQCFANFYTVFAFQQNSPLTKFFDERIAKLIEHGFVDHRQRSYIATKEAEYMNNFFGGSENEVRQKIDTSKLQGAFFLLIFGYALGTVVFVVEYALCKN